MIHEEETQPHEEEGDVHAMTEAHSLLIGGSIRAHSSVLGAEGGKIS